MNRNKSENYRAALHDINNDLGVAIASIQVATLKTNDESLKLSLGRAESAFFKLKDKTSKLRQMLRDDGLIVDLDDL